MTNTSQTATSSSARKMPKHDAATSLITISEVLQKNINPKDFLVSHDHCSSDSNVSTKVTPKQQNHLKVFSIIS